MPSIGYIICRHRINILKYYVVIIFLRDSYQLIEKKSKVEIKLDVAVNLSGKTSAKHRSSVQTKKLV